MKMKMELYNIDLKGKTNKATMERNSKNILCQKYQIEKVNNINLSKRKKLMIIFGSILRVSK